MCSLTTVHCGATLFPALPTIAGYCVWVRVKLGSRVHGSKGTSVDPSRRSLQNGGYRVPRIPLPRTRVYKSASGDCY